MAVDYTARLPSPAVPMVDANGVLTPAWFSWFLALFARTGGATGVGAAGAIRRSGDSLTGPLLLAGDPTAPLGAATKQYVDTLPTIGASVLTWPAGTLVANGSYPLFLAWPWASGTVTSVAAAIATGSFTAAVQINGRPVAGLGAVAVNTLDTVTTPAGANALVAGDSLTVVVSGITASNADFTTDFSPIDFGTGTVSATSNATLQVNYVHRSLSAAVVGGFTSDFSPRDFVVL